MNLKKIQNKTFLLFLIGFLATTLIFSTNNTYVLSLDEQNSSESHLTALTSRDPILIYNNSAFGLYGFPGDGSPGNPYRIENYNITATAAHGIHINNTNLHFIIQNCYIDVDLVGIFILGVYNQTATIENNYCVNNDICGISIDSGFESTIVDNILIHNGDGIYTFFCDGSVITNNTCLWNDNGMYIYDTYKTLINENNCSYNANYGIHLETTWKNTVKDNICNNNLIGILSNETSRLNLNNNLCTNNDYGMILASSTNSRSNITFNKCFDSSSFGLFIVDYGFAMIANNSIKNNGLGIGLGQAENLTIKYNLFEQNTDYGAQLDTVCNNNIFHHNAFINNALGLGKQQAYDDGISTIWYDVSTNEGNFWSDWGGTGDYSIDGSAGTFDLYPLGSSPIVAEFSSSIHLLYLALFISISSTVFVLKRKYSKRK